MIRVKEAPESGKKLRFDGPQDEMGYDVVLRSKNPRIRGAGITVDVVDNYNQYSGWIKTFPDTAEGYVAAKTHFDRIVAYGYRLPVKSRNPEALPEGLFD